MKSKRKRTLRTILIAVVALGVLAMGGGWFLNRQQRIRANAAPQAGDVVTAFIGELDARASASGKLVPRQEARLSLGTTGQVESVRVRVGEQVGEGDLLVQLATDGLQRAVESAEQNLAIQKANLAELRKEAEERDVVAAQAAVANAQAQLDELLAGPSVEEQARAEASLESAQAKLADLLAGASQEELAQAQAALVSAKAALQAAQVRFEALDDQLVVADNAIHVAQLGKDRARDQYNLLVWNDWKAGVSWAPYSPQGVGVKKAQVDYDVAVANRNLVQLNINDGSLRRAQSQVAQAEAALAALTEEQTAQIAAARAQVARAEASLAALTEERTAQIASAHAQLAGSRADLARLIDGASEEQLAIAEAQVEQARISLEEALDSLAKASLIAPFDGLVTDVYVAVGEWASGPAVELVNTHSLEIVLDVDEIDIGSVAVGQPTVIILEPWPDRELSGQVASIAPEAKIVGEIVSFEVRLSFEPGDLPILTGMTANADLITSTREEVLLVHNRAIIADRQAGKYYVNRVQGDEMERVEVTIGLRDATYTEILSGLHEGERVFIGEVEEGLDFGSGPPEGVHRGMGQ